MRISYLNIRELNTKKKWGKVTWIGQSTFQHVSVYTQNTERETPKEIGDSPRETLNANLLVVLALNFYREGLPCMEDPIKFNQSRWERWVRILFLLLHIFMYVYSWCGGPELLDDISCQVQMSTAPSPGNNQCLQSVGGHRPSARIRARAPCSCSETIARRRYGGRCRGLQELQWTWNVPQQTRRIRCFTLHTEPIGNSKFSRGHVGATQWENRWACLFEGGKKKTDLPGSCEQKRLPVTRPRRMRVGWSQLRLYGCVSTHPFASTYFFYRCLNASRGSIFWRLLRFQRIDANLPLLCPNKPWTQIGLNRSHASHASSLAARLVASRKKQHPTAICFTVLSRHGYFVLLVIAKGFLEKKGSHRNASIFSCRAKLMRRFFLLLLLLRNSTWAPKGLGLYPQNSLSTFQRQW